LAGIPLQYGKVMLKDYVKDREKEAVSEKKHK